MPKKLVLPRDPVTGQFLTRKVKDVAEQKNLTGKAARIATKAATPTAPPIKPSKVGTATPEPPKPPMATTKFVGKKP